MKPSLHLNNVALDDLGLPPVSASPNLRIQVYTTTHHSYCPQIMKDLSFAHGSLWDSFVSLETSSS